MLAEIWTIWLEMAPWLLLGALAASLIHVFLPTGFVNRHLSGRLGVLKAVLIGIPLPLCSCAVIPAGLGLKKSGASDGAAVGFLISTPQTGIDSILVSGSLLGWPFALLKVVVALLTGWIGGVAVGSSSKPKVSLLKIVDDSPMSVTAPQQSRWMAFRQHFVMLIQSLWGWLVVGVLVSAGISFWVPEDTISTLPGFSGWPSLFLVLLIAIPLYVCATASVPIAAALVGSGLSPGAALVFLMAGPATNLATIGAVYKTLGRRPLVVYLTSIVIGSVLAGAFFNQVIPATAVAGHLHSHSHSAAWWQIASSVFLAAMVAWFAGGDLMTFMERFRSPAELDGRRFDIQGMTCTGCAAKLKSCLVADSKVTAARVSFPDASAVISGDVSSERVSELAEQAGFRATLSEPPQA